MADVLAQAQFPQVPGGEIPKTDQGYTRIPFLFLVDVSGSTSIDHITQTVNGPNADIHRFHSTLQQMLGKLRVPDNDDLRNAQPGIDVSIITYSTGYTRVLDWTPAPQLNPALAPFHAHDATETYEALTHALAYVGDRIRFYKQRNLKYGRPYIFHFTDGAPTDMPVNGQNWNTIKSRVSKATGANDPEKVTVDLRHLITENAVDPTRSQVSLPDGTKTTGLKILVQLSGAKHCFALEDHPDMVGELVDFMARTITSITTILGSSLANSDEEIDKSIDDAAADADHIHTAEDILDAEDDEDKNGKKDKNGKP